MKSPTAFKHVHIYERLSNSHSMFRCMIPECPHIIQSAMLINRKAACPYCSRQFIITPEHLRRKKVHCMLCAKTQLPTKGDDGRLDALTDVVLSAMRKTDHDARLVLEEKRTVNGRHVLALQIDLTATSTPCRFYGYCYAGTSGTHHVWTFTTQDMFDKTTETLTEFLNNQIAVASEQDPAAPLPTIR